MSKIGRKSLQGLRFGRLTVVEQVPSTNKNSRWLCNCECGKTTEVSRQHLVQGKTQSCGCFGEESRKTHGLSGTRPYSIWDAMVQRCSNSNSISFSNYGGRGICYDLKWKTFEGFWEDMAEGYSDALELDRIDVNGNYCKENCRWTNGSEQSYNRRRQSNNTTGRTGVSTKHGKWEAHIKKGGVKINLGLFDNYEDAVRCRESAELIYFGYNKE